MLLGLLPLACLSFGTVHPWARVALALACIVLGWRLWRVGRTASTVPVLWMKRLTVGAVLVSVLPLLTVGPSARGWLHGALADPVSQMLALSGSTTRPLALDPWRGLIEWGVIKFAVCR